MAWNGSGLFVRLYNWVNDRDSAINIDAPRMDAEMDGMATGITNCVAKDGQNSATANLPMGGFRHTGVGNASARTDYLSMAQFQDCGGIYYTDTGSANTYVITPSPAITAYAAGQRFKVNIANASTGASTLNVNALGAKSIVDLSGSAIGSGALLAGGIYDLIYDGTNFIVTNGSIPLIKSGSWTPVLEGSTTAGTHTYTTQNGKYYAVGGLVWCACVMTLSALDGAAAGNARITGLPAPQKHTGANARPAAMFSVISAVSAGSGNVILGDIPSASSRVDLSTYAQSGGSWASLPITAFTNTSSLNFTIIYEHDGSL